MLNINSDLKQDIYSKAYEIYTGTKEDRPITRKDIENIRKLEQVILNCFHDMLLTNDSELNEYIESEINWEIKERDMTKEFKTKEVV